MSYAFWYWLIMVLWAIGSIVVSNRNRAWFAGFYWGWNGILLVLFLLFLFIGLKDFPDPFGTLAHR